MNYNNNAPPEQVKKKIAELLSKLKDHNVSCYNNENDHYFQIKFSENAEMISKIIVIPFNEVISFSKISHCSEKSVTAWVVNIDYTYTVLQFKDSELNYSGFKEKLKRIPRYGLMTDSDYLHLYNFFMLSSKIGLPSSTEYLEDGLTYDREYYIYKGKNISLPVKEFSIDDGTADHCKKTFEAFIGCCPKGKAMLLLMIHLIGLSFEVIKSLPQDKRRKCQPTVLPYIFGESGCGKTTISRAFFDAYDESRFISLSTATEAAIQKKLSGEFGGIVVIDDVQHTSIAKCASKTTEKLEAVIRTFGDIGAEKTTVSGKLSETCVWAVVTAESIFTKVESSILRLLPISFSRGEIDFECVQRLENLDESKNIFFHTYLRWFLSKISFENDMIVDIPALTEGYRDVSKELSNLYYDICHARILDNHIRIVTYFNFFSDFFGMIGISGSYLSDIKSELLGYLHNAVELQCVSVYETTLPYYICQTIDNILSEGNVGTFSIKGSDRTNIDTKGIASDVIAYSNQEVLIFTFAQQQKFFSMIKKALPNGNNIRNKDIKQALISMGILLNVKNDEPLKTLDKNNKISLNGNETRVIKIKIIKNKEIDTNESI